MDKDKTLIWPSNKEDQAAFWDKVIARVTQHGFCNVDVPNFTADDVYISQARVVAEFGISPRKLRQFRADGTLPATHVARWGKRVEYNYARRAIKDFLARSPGAARKNPTP